MAKQLNVNLSFNADTSKAKAQIQSLNNSLKEIAKMPGNAANLFDDTEIKKASNAALELQQHLSNAVNVDTGKLDLSRFSSSLKAANKDLDTYFTTLISTGEVGQRAFLQLAQAIASAEAPMTRVNAKMAEFGTTLKNTVRWQFSSSILHGFMGTVQSAYRYAQDLNKSLNDIRIVTGQNTDEMAKFAEAANKAAKNLSTTTTEYTNASLIYYQQGLSDEEVQARTDITIKMANAAGVSAQTASDQLTAIWNNFYDGSKSLEYYADVMTALGAATASSTDEISEGLNKFAAVAETVGLSYEYATAALATVTATTRESADVVGTAFKTLFARIQGLNLGETLEDGTDLNKYSLALAKVGIDIKDVNGNMKDMDKILNELGAKWETLNKDQQTALAQTVAGVRQYTQLVALMDNWDYFQENLGVASGAEGALQEQAEIYADSWEAASNRVRAAAEGIYQNLIDDEFFITLINGFEKVLSLIDSIVQGFGGLKGVITTVGSLLLTHYAQAMPETLNNLKQNLLVVTGQGQKLTKELQDKTAAYLALTSSQSGVSNVYKVQAEGVQELLQMQQKLMDNQKNLTTQEVAAYKAKIENVQAIYEEVTALAEKKEQLDKLSKSSAENLIKDASTSATKLQTSKTGAEQQKKSIQEVGLAAADDDNNFQFEQQIQAFEAAVASIDSYNEKISKMVSTYNELGVTIPEVDGKLNITAQTQQEMETVVANLVQQYQSLIEQSTKLEVIGTDIGTQTKAWSESAKEIDKSTDATKDAKKNMQVYLNTLKKLTNGFKDLDLPEDEAKQFDEKLKKLEKTLNTTETSTENCAQEFSELGQIMSGAISRNLTSMDDSIETVNTQLRDLQLSGDKLKTMKQSTEEAAEGTTKLALAQTNARGQAEANIQSQFKLSVALTEFGATAMSVYSTLTAFSTFISTLGDESASTLDKVGASISVLMAILSTYNAVQSFTTTLEKGGTAAKIAKTIATWLHIPAATADTAATTAEAGAYTLLGIAISPVTLVMLALLAAMLVVVATAWIVVKVFKAIQANSPEGKLKALEEQAKRSAEAFNKVQEAVTATSEALDALDSHYDTIAQLTIGTTEWYQAVADVNYEIAKLLEQYPELASYLYQENGIMKISQEGIDYIKNQQTQLLSAAQNIKINDQKAVNEAKAEQVFNKTTFAKGVHTTTEPLWDMAVQLYRDDRIGENLFTRDMAEEIVNSTWGTKEQYRAEYVEGSEHYGDEDWESDVQDMQELLKDNQEYIRQAAQLLDLNQQLDNAQLETKLASVGSMRTAEQGRDLLGQDGYQGILEDTREDIVKTFGDWNDHKNYNTSKDTSQTEWKMIEDFMKLQGGNTKYVAQRWGKMVIEIDGKEESFTKDQVFDALAELYSGDEFKAQMQANLAESLGTIAPSIDFSGLSADALIGLDNFNIQLQNTLGHLEEVNTDNIFASVVSHIGTGEQALAEFGNTINSIDFSSTENLRTFTAAAQQLEEGLKDGAYTVNDFTLALEKMAAVSELENMDSYFTSAASQLGLGDEEAEIMQEYARNLMEVSESSDELSSDLATNAEGAADLAVEVTRMNTGIKKLAEGFEDWSDVIDNSSKTSYEYAEAMVKMKDALSDVLDVESDLISSGFVEKHLEKIKAAASGSAEAIDELRALMDEEIIANITLGQTDEFINNVKQLDTDLQAVVPKDIQVGVILQDDAFLKAANALVQNAQMTADEANAYFAGIGYEPVYSTTDIENANSLEVPSASTTLSIDHVGWSDVPVDLPDWFPGDHTITLPNITYSAKPAAGDPEEAPANMRLTSFSGDGTPPEIKGMRKKASGSMNDYSSSNSGGPPPSTSSGGGNKKTKPKKVEVGERYKEITDSISDMTDAIDDASKSADRLYGQGRLNQMKAANNLLMEEIGLLKQKKVQAETYLAEDRDSLDKAAKEANVTLDIDDNGRITNYTSVVEILEKRIKDLQNAAMANDGEISESEQEGIDQLQEQADNLLSAIEQYDGTRETLEDVTNQINDQFYTWQDNNYEMLTYSLEIKMDIQDDELETVEYYLDAIADDFYSMAEAAALMVGGLGNSNSQLDIFRDNLEINAQHIEDLSGAFARGEISHAAYVEGIQNSREAIYDNLTSLRELDKAMMEYYGETLDMASEKIDEHISKMEFQAEKLEHFQNVMAKLGKETDYKSMGTILEGAEAVSKNQVKAAKDVLDFYTGEAETYLAQYQDAIARGDQAAAEMAYQYYTDAMERATEAEKEYMASLENWADAARAVLDNKLASFASDFEKSLTGGSSFDQILTSMERAVTLQEEYLTATNQIYETNKLMRTAQQQIDKSTNSVAKSKLQNFIKETEQLQSQGQLSQFELEIQQAKYDLLLAEIALQEAQDAKSVVRLQRDSEGNFGYVYTADQNQVSEAQQQYEDAQNALYNIGLEGANEYAEKSIQAQAEFTQTMSELQQAYLEGAFASEEEYNRAVEEAKAAYYQQLQTYSNLYSVALTTDSRVVADAWSTDFSNMVTNTDQWSQAVDGYIFQVSGAFQEWGNTADQIANASGTNLDNLEHNVQDIVTESENLVESLTGDGGLIEALSGELEKVREVTTAYGEQRQSVLDLIGTYEGLASSLNNAALAQTNYNSAAHEDPPTYQGGTVGGTGSNVGGGTGTGSGNGGGTGTGGGSGSGNRYKATYQLQGKSKTLNGYNSEDAARSAAESAIQKAIDVLTGLTFTEKNEMASSAKRSISIARYDTGGYTGSWGAYGKLGILDEKELILDKNDTSNFLASMEVLERILKVIDLQAINSQFGGMLSTPTLNNNTTSQTIDQNVHIEANFPGVSSSDEIEEAFNNLINQASQYVNRK